MPQLSTTPPVNSHHIMAHLILSEPITYINCDLTHQKHFAVYALRSKLIYGRKDTQLRLCHDDSICIPRRQQISCVHDTHAQCKQCTHRCVFKYLSAPQICMTKYSRRQKWAHSGKEGCGHLLPQMHMTKMAANGKQWKSVSFPKNIDKL